MRSVQIALAAGLAVVCVAVGLSLLRSPMSVAATNRPSGESEQPIASTDRGASYCQPGEALPRGTTAIRVWLDASYGPRVRLAVSSGGHPVTEGEQAGWTGGSVTVPVKPLPHAVSDATVCATFHLHDETVIVQGNTPAPGRQAARMGPHSTGASMWIEYLRPGSRSWASLAASVFGHMEFGRATPGPWVVLLALGLLAAVVTLASQLVLKELP